MRTTMSNSTMWILTIMRSPILATGVVLPLLDIVSASRSRRLAGWQLALSLIAMSAMIAALGLVLWQDRFVSRQERIVEFGLRPTWACAAIFIGTLAILVAAILRRSREHGGVVE